MASIYAPTLRFVGFGLVLFDSFQLCFLKGLSIPILLFVIFLLIAINIVARVLFNHTSIIRVQYLTCCAGLSTPLAPLKSKLICTPTCSSSCLCVCFTALAAPPTSLEHRNQFQTQHQLPIQQQEQGQSQSPMAPIPLSRSARSVSMSFPSSTSYTSTVPPLSSRLQC